MQRSLSLEEARRAGAESAKGEPTYPAERKLESHGVRRSNVGMDGLSGSSKPAPPPPELHSVAHRLSPLQAALRIQAPVLHVAGASPSAGTTRLPPSHVRGASESLHVRRSRPGPVKRGRGWRRLSCPRGLHKKMSSEIKWQYACGSRHEMFAHLWQRRVR